MSLDIDVCVNGSYIERINVKIRLKVQMEIN